MIEKNLYLTITDQLNTGVIVVDMEFNIVMWNRFLQVHANKDSEQVIGKSIYTVFPELPRRWFERKLSSVIQLKNHSFCSWEQRHHLFELPHTRPITTDSSFMAQNCTFLPIIPEDDVEQICILIEDATDVCHYQTTLGKTLDDLALASRIDGLTQIFNRKYWEECLANEFRRAKRYNSELTLIMFDLDHFKSLNDNYGHQCGDLVLIEVSRKIKSLLRLCDVFGRYGGEEFSIILPETGLRGAKDVAEKIRKAIAELVINYQDETINISASVGVAAVNKCDSRYEDLISHSDVALYQAKALGRNTVCLSQQSIEIESSK